MNINANDKILVEIAFEPEILIFLKKRSQLTNESLSEIVNRLIGDAAIKQYQNYQNWNCYPWSTTTTYKNTNGIDRGYSINSTTASSTFSKNEENN